MGVCNKHLGDKIFVAHLHACPALAAAALGPIGRKWHAFDIASMTHGDDHILTLDQIFIFNFTFVLHNFGTAWRRKISSDLR